MALSGVRLDVSILTTPDELRRQYAAIRKQLLKGKRLRPGSVKHARLAEFAVRVESALSRADMEDWNKCFPAWRYNSTSNFYRDCRVAQHRVLGFTKKFKEVIDAWPLPPL